MSDIKREILEEAGRIVNGARRSAYGTPENNFERIARFWQAYFENTGRGEVKITAADVSPMMRLMKEARLCESPDHRDSFVDIVGYAMTGAEINIQPQEQEEREEEETISPYNWEVGMVLKPSRPFRTDLVPMQEFVVKELGLGGAVLASKEDDKQRWSNFLTVWGMDHMPEWYRVA